MSAIAVKESVDYKSVSDNLLAKLAGKQDMNAFEEIYNRHHRRIFGHCFTILQSTIDAEDLTSEVFVQLLRKIHTFKGNSKFTT